MRRFAMLVGLAASLCACASGPDNSGLKEGHARKVPVLILDTSWNGASDPTWHGGGVVPKNGRNDEIYAQFVNSGEAPIAELKLHVSYCANQSGSTDAGWMTFEGPFAPGQVYKAIPTLPDGLSVEKFMSHPGSTHLRITG